MSVEQNRTADVELEERVRERTAELTRANRRLQAEVSELRRLGEDALRESERRFGRFMQQLPGLAWIKDLQGRYVYVNDAAERAFRLPRAELYGKTDFEIFPPEIAAQFVENDRHALADGTGKQVIETLEHAEGVLHHSIVSKFPIPGRDGAPALIGGMAIDITDRMRAEEALREADRRKDEFLAMLGHELRNPLAGILNGVEVLNQIDAPDGEGAEIRAVIARQAAHMSHLVDDLLDVTRIMRGKIVLKKEPVDLVELIHHVVEDHRRQLENQGAALRVQLPAGPVWCAADATRLAQVFANLLANAAKFMDGPGDVTVEAWAEGERRRAVVSVRDTGIGMELETLRNIFQPFVQAERTLDRSRGGLGLGLALVKGVVELHGGRVIAASAGVGRGSQFTVELPLCAGRKSEPAVAADQSLPAARKRVLLIDDRRDAILPARRMLELAGHDVTIAGDGPSGVALAREIVPDVILCDIGLPDGMSGYDVARAIRAEPRLREIYVVAVSGYGQEEDRQKAREAGFDYHLTKPVSKASLESLMATLPRFA
jgi:PAS domain S-box-containing protein